MSNSVRPYIRLVLLGLVCVPLLLSLAWIHRIGAAQIVLSGASVGSGALYAPDSPTVGSSEEVKQMKRVTGVLKELGREVRIQQGVRGDSPGER